MFTLLVKSCERPGVASIRLLRDVIRSDPRLLRHPRSAEPASYAGAEFVLLHRDGLHVGLRRTRMLVVERVLRLDHAARILGEDPREGVPGLVEVDVLDARTVGVGLQVLDE